MASTNQGRALTERHRRGQISLRARFLKAFVPYWSLLEWTRLDQTAPTWTKLVAKVVREYRQESANLAAEYYDRYRDVEAPNSPIPTPIVEFHDAADDAELLSRITSESRRPATDTRGHEPRPSLPRSARKAITVNGHTYHPDENGLVKPRIDWSEFDKAVERSLLVTGPGELKRRAARGETEAMAKRNGLVTVSGAASRHVLTGGRETVTTLTQADRTALGWARVTDSDPCAFCAMLASRGPVYRSAAQAGFKAHDHCACTAEPTYSRDAAWPGRAREFQKLWYDATSGYSGKDAINAFRREIEKQRRAR